MIKDMDEWYKYKIMYYYNNIIKFMYYYMFLLLIKC